MSLSRAEVEKVSLLGRLQLTPAELDLMTTQLSAVVGYIEQLKELSTDDVEPMAHAVPTSNVFRDDVVTPSADRALILSNAPHADGEFYLVPAVLGE
ncbi:MAG: Asp-tRNA(Asn)/Glu-tRNA(Gln) amidotransferase GatCAB subunit C [Pirellula sp.]|nr:Asp-tRNA(Asn)/Glu-tRNA(Gln) amidotransferase GatCAB subunit C [Pirellula sp.]